MFGVAFKASNCNVERGCSSIFMYQEVVIKLLQLENEYSKMYFKKKQRNKTKYLCIVVNKCRLFIACWQISVAFSLHK